MYLFILHKKFSHLLQFIWTFYVVEIILKFFFFAPGNYCINITILYYYRPRQRRWDDKNLYFVIIT